MDDKEIIQMFRERDESALAAMSKKYGSYCFFIARNILGNQEDAEECINDAYLNLWNSIPPAEPEVLSVYLGKIVRNLSFNLYKKKTAKKRGCGQIPAVLDELSELISDASTTESKWNEKLLIESINEFLAMLPEKKRTIFVLRYWYSCSIKEIAKKIGMADNTVAVQLKRLRVKLHNYLKERDFEL